MLPCHGGLGWFAVRRTCLKVFNANWTLQWIGLVIIEMLDYGYDAIEFGRYTDTGTIVQQAVRVIVAEESQKVQQQFKRSNWL